MEKEKTINLKNVKPVVKTLSKSIREYKKPSILTPILVMFEVILECLIPYAMTILLGAIDYISGSGVAASEQVVSIVNFLSWGKEPDMLLIILQFGLIMLVLAFLSLMFGSLSGKFCAQAASGLAKNLRKDMYYNIQSFSFTNMNKYPTSSLITRLTTDVSNVEMAYMMIIRTAIRSPFMLIFSLVMAFSLNSTMALIYVVTAPILFIGLVLIMRKALPQFNKIFPKYDKMNESVEESVRGIRVVKSYVRESHENQKFSNASLNVKKDFTKAEKIVSLNNPLMNFCVYGGIIAIYVIGSIMVINSNNTLLKYTEIQSFMTYSVQILMSLMMLSMIFVMVIISAVSAKRIAEILNEKSTIVSPANAIKNISDGSIEFSNASFKYFETAEKYSLQNINLKINSGETIGIIGATGSGKTSLVQLIPRLYDVDIGEVKVGGLNVKNYDLETLRNSVAMVLQKNVLFSGTIKENLRWGDKTATDNELIEASKLAQADEFIQTLPKKYDTYIEQGGVNVSGGQKQRLCIARALLKKPKILILDDSTSAVDTKTDALIRNAFKKYIPNTTKIIIAQRIASVMEADKIVILDCGTITAIGTHDYLLKNNKIYQELYYSQNNAGANENIKGAN